MGLGLSADSVSLSVLGEGEGGDDIVGPDVVDIDGDAVDGERPRFSLISLITDTRFAYFWLDAKSSFSMRLLTSVIPEISKNLRMTDLADRHSPRLILASLASSPSWFGRGLPAIQYAPRRFK